MERRKNLESRKLAKVATILGALTLPISLAGCTGSSALIKLTPNMSRFLESGTSNTCHNGGPRPCAVLLRTKPELKSEYINANPYNQYTNTVNWPLESYDHQPGNQVTVECYVANGARVTSYEGHSSSTYWYEVAVPPDHVLNPTVIEEINEPHSTLKTIQQGGQTALVGWASVEWFDQSTPVGNVHACM